MMMGCETEFGILDGWSLTKAETIQAEVLKSQRYLDSMKSGVFLENGARAYVDQGRQNEYSTPETDSPSDLVIRELAGRRLMAACAKKVGHTMLCTHIDPVSGTTWGAHENYECKRPARVFATESLYPHLVSRIIYTGAGGIDPNHPGVRLVLSPRGSMIRASFSSQGFPCKALVFGKPDAYCEGSRLHLLCGESQLCHSANYLKYAATALVAFCLDEGLSIGPGPFAVAPARALHGFNRDLSLSVRVPLRDGRRLTALEIQESFLDGVESHLDRLPDWAPLAVSRWRQALAALRCGDPVCSQRIDWLVYGGMVEALAEEFGYTAEDLRHANGAAACGLPVKEAGRLHELRAAANALYVKLHILGVDSLFDKLVVREEGGNDHFLAEVTEDAIQKALLEPPPGRAANRSALIRKYFTNGCCSISWNTLLDGLHNRRLDISQADGWCEPAVWQAEEQTAEQKCRIAAKAFRRGNYDHVISLLEPLFSSGEPRSRAGVYSDLCLSYARTGMKDRVQASLTASGAQLFENPFEQAVFTLFCTVNFGLCPPLHEMEHQIKTCDRLLEEESASAPFDVGYDNFVLNQNRVVALTQRGDLEGAERISRQLLSDMDNLRRTRMTARTRCHLANVLYLQGKEDAAKEELRLALKTHTEEKMWWDLAEYSLPMTAKLATECGAAQAALMKAEDLHRQMKNPLGLAKILCLKARRLKTRDGLDELVRLCVETPSLRGCPTAAKVIHQWNTWALGQITVSGPDDYWGI